MKVLILGAPTTNGLKAFGLGKHIFGGGWVENLVNGISRYNEIDLYVSFFSYNIKQFSSAKVDNVTYICMPTDDAQKNKVTEVVQRSLALLLDYVNPDIVNIIGTERPYNYELIKLINNKNKVLVSFTGIVSFIYHHYLGQIDSSELSKRSIGDVYRHGGPIAEQRIMKEASLCEKRLLSQVKYVSGRTTWDYACAKLINPDLQYFYCGEILNNVFFEYKWEFSKCNKHSIFVSQGSYPLKGFHMLLQAFPDILREYPDAVIRIAGPNLLKSDSIVDKLKKTTYAKYLTDLIKRLNIPTQNIVFTGPLSADKMKDEYLKANVFVMPSIIENSPNSIGEAMALGVPIVASYVGGIPDMIIHNKTGYLYPSDEPYMLSYYICKIFEKSNEIVTMSDNERSYAKERFNKEKVITDILKLYKIIANG